MKSLKEISVLADPYKALSMEKILTKLETEPEMSRFPLTPEFPQDMQDKVNGIFNKHTRAPKNSSEPPHAEWSKIAYSSSGNLLAVGLGVNSTGGYLSDKSYVEIWDINDIKKVDPVCTFPEAPLAREKGWIFALEFSPDESLLVIGTAMQNIFIYDRIGKKLVEKISNSHSQRVTTLAFFPDGKHFLSGSSDKTVRLWDIYGNPRYAFPAHDGSIAQVQCLNSKLFLVRTGTNYLYLWSKETKECLQQLKLWSFSRLAHIFTGERPMIVIQTNAPAKPTLISILELSKDGKLTLCAQNNPISLPEETSLVQSSNSSSSNTSNKPVALSPTSNISSLSIFNPAPQHAPQPSPTSPGGANAGDDVKLPIPV